MIDRAITNTGEEISFSARRERGKGGKGGNLWRWISIRYTPLVKLCVCFSFCLARIFYVYASIICSTPFCADKKQWKKRTSCFTGFACYFFHLICVCGAAIGDAKKCYGSMCYVRFRFKLYSNFDQQYVFVFRMVWALKLTSFCKGVWEG